MTDSPEKLEVNFGPCGKCLQGILGTVMMVGGNNYHPSCAPLSSCRAVEQERDRYRAALERIAWSGDLLDCVSDFAYDALSPPDEGE